MTNWKLLLRKYIAHVRHWEGVDYLDEPPSSRDPFPLSADELSVLRELSEQTTESVAAEQAAAASLPDDREPITEDWWREEKPASSICSAYLCFNGGVYLSVFDGKQVTLKLPAVRARGDVRTLVKLLGRE